MIELNRIEARVLGVLVEKAHTVGAPQYPLSLNSLAAGCNQKSNRDPVVSYSEDQVLEAAESLQAKGLVVVSSPASSRVWKYKHNAREALDVSTNELVVLAELLLRGPQTVGELRTRASRMHPLESLEVVRHVLDHMIRREPPLVTRLEPAAGNRAERFGQRLCPDLHETRILSEVSPEAPGRPDPGASPTTVPPAPSGPDLTRRVERLEERLEQVAAALAHLAEKLGEQIELPSPGESDEGRV